MTEESLFELVLQAPEAERTALIDQLCAGDAGMRTRLVALLAADQKAAGWLTRQPDVTGPFDRAGEPSLDTTAGMLIAGRYKLLQRIGEGGMGSVWMAEQVEPVKRRVAVKLIRAERGSSRAILARFEAERQAIALMDHPHIAKLLDAGTCQTGQPFFVMELVKGVPLNQFCDEQQLSIPERLRLFVQICSAVQHAHQKGIIHRDLKPGNILVENHDGTPVPKVIDFGLAKATNDMQLTEKSLFTAFGSVVGTPLYMAPEQARFDAVDVDTRADIYALGVVLYELLTGTTPLTRATLKQAALDEVLRQIREQEPQPPSSRIGDSEIRPTLAANRQADPNQLERFVKGELDWIALKALAKERDRRYETASNFARDIERYLNNEPVSAGPPSASYRFRKFVRRNRPQVIAAALVLVTLVLGLAGTTIGFILANQARQVAQTKESEAIEAAEQERLARNAEKSARIQEAQERQFAEAIAEFVRHDFLALTSVEGQDRFAGGMRIPLSPSLTLKQLLDRAADKLDARKDLSPRIESDLRWMVGVNYRGQGEYEKAIRHLRRCLELQRKLHGEQAYVTLCTKNSLGFAYQAAMQLDKATPLLEETFQAMKTTLGPNHITTLKCMSNLAVCYMEAGKYDRSEDLLQAALRIRKPQLEPDHPDILGNLHVLGLLSLRMGKPEAGVVLLDDVLQRRQKKLDPDHPDIAFTMGNLGMGYLALEKPDKAFPLLETAYDRVKVRLGQDHPETVASMINLGLGYEALRKFDQAIVLFEKSYELNKQRFGPAHPTTINSMQHLGSGYLSAGNPARAVPLLEEALKLRKAKLSADHPEVLSTINNLALSYVNLGKHPLGVPLLEEAYERFKIRLGPEHTETLTCMKNLAYTLHTLGKYERSVPLFEEALTLTEKTLGRSHPTTQFTLAHLGVNYRDSGKVDKAIPLLEEACRSRDKLPVLGTYRFALLGAYSIAGKTTAGVKLANELLTEARKALPSNSRQLNGATEYGQYLLQHGTAADAEPLLAECLSISQKVQPETWTTFQTQSLLGGAMLAQMKCTEAEPHLRKGYEGLKKHEKAIPQGNDAIGMALDRLIEWCVQTNKVDDAKKYREEREKYSGR